MAVLSIIKLFQPNLYCPGSCLRMKCESVREDEFSAAWFHQLVKDMLETMYSQPSGSGLSANQVGILKRIAVTDYARDGKKPLVLVNPVMTPLSEEKFESKEVCLSFPNLSVRVDRYKKIKVSFQDITGAYREVESEGRRAVLFQHEISHLEGIPHVDLVTGEDDIAYYEGTVAMKTEAAYKKIKEQTP